MLVMQQWLTDTIMKANSTEGNYNNLLLLIFGICLIFGDSIHDCTLTQIYCR